MVDVITHITLERRNCETPHPQPATNLVPVPGVGMHLLQKA